MALDTPFIPFRFEVVLDLDTPSPGLESPLCEAAFAECDGLEMTMQTKTLEVNVPPGVDEGTRIRLSGEGEAGARGAPAGDLYIFLHVKRHPLFEREGTALHARAPIIKTFGEEGYKLVMMILDQLGRRDTERCKP